MVIYIVLSRDNSNYIYATTDKKLALKEKKNREYCDGMDGGRDVFRIKETILN